METDKPADSKPPLLPVEDGPYTPLHGRRTVLEDGAILLPIETDLGLSSSRLPPGIGPIPSVHEGGTMVGLYVVPPDVALDKWYRVTNVFEDEGGKTLTGDNYMLGSQLLRGAKFVMAGFTLKATTVLRVS